MLTILLAGRLNSLSPVDAAGVDHFKSHMYMQNLTAFFWTIMVLLMMASCRKALTVDSPLPIKTFDKIDDPTGPTFPSSPAKVPGPDLGRATPFLYPNLGGMEPPVTDKPGATPKLLRPALVCINSYDELIGFIGSNQLRISRVILSDGTIVEPGSNIVSMTYTATYFPTSSSLFNSTLQVGHNTYGFLQILHQEVWTLGCVYPNAGVGPFTNLSYKGRLLAINTAFTWSAPPIGGNNLRVSWVIVD